MATFTDDFNRANSGANAGFGANWAHTQETSSSTTGAEVLSNQASYAASFTDRAAIWNGGSVGADQYSFATVVSSSVDGGTYVICRGTNADNHYGFGLLNPTTIRIYARVAGVNNAIATDTVTVNAGSKLELRVTGTGASTSLSGYVDDVLVLGPVTDTNGYFSSGQPGLKVTNSSIFDAWGGGDLGASTTTLSPSQATLTIAGNAPLANSFTNVRIREVFINEAGSPLSNMTGMSLQIWYAGSPNGAPDLSYSAVTTDAAGTMSYSIATGSLIYNQAIFYLATDGHASLSAWTCARMTPTYT